MKHQKQKNGEQEPEYDRSNRAEEGREKRRTYRMVRSDFFLIDPFSHLIFLCIFDITTHTELIAVISVECRSATFGSTLVHVCLSVYSLGEFLQNQQPSKSLSSSKGTLEYGRVDSIAVHKRPVNFEAPVTVLRKSILVRWRATGEVNGVALSDESGNSAGCSIDLFPIICGTGTVNIKTCDDLRDGIVKTKNNLDMAGGVLRCNGNGVLRTDGGRLVKDAVLDVSLDLLDLLQTLFFAETVKKEIDVTGGSKMFMVIFSQASLASGPLLRYWEKSGRDGGTSCDDIVPIEICEG